MLKGNNRRVTERIRAHIAEYYTPQELTEQLKAFDYMQGGNYHKIKHMVQGGCFLVYHVDVQKFLYEAMEATEAEKKYDNEQSWELYKHLIALQGEKIVDDGFYSVDMDKLEQLGDTDAYDLDIDDRDGRQVEMYLTIPFKKKTDVSVVVTLYSERDNIDYIFYDGISDLAPLNAKDTDRLALLSKRDGVFINAPLNYHHNKADQEIIKKVVKKLEELGVLPEDSLKAVVSGMIKDDASFIFDVKGENPYA